MVASDGPEPSDSLLQTLQLRRSLHTLVYTSVIRIRFLEICSTHTSAPGHPSKATRTPAETPESHSRYSSVFVTPLNHRNPSQIQTIAMQYVRITETYDVYNLMQ